MLLTCLEHFIIWVILAVLIVFGFEMGTKAMYPLPDPIYNLIRFLVMLLLVIMFVNCTGLLGGGLGLK